MLREQIIARLPEWPTNWSEGGGVANYSLDGNHWCGGGSKMQYRMKVPQSETNTIYHLQWYEVTVFQDSTNITSVPQTGIVVGTGDPVNPAVGDTITVDVPQSLCTIYETAPEVIEVTHPDDPGSPPGHGGPHGNPIQASNSNP
jgi:hypothetical protein